MFKSFDDFSKVLTHLFLTALVGLVGIGLTFMDRMVNKLEAVNVSVREQSARLELTSEKLSHYDYLIKDHEARLRLQERRVK